MNKLMNEFTEMQMKGYWFLKRSIIFFDLLTVLHIIH